MGCLVRGRELCGSSVGGLTLLLLALAILHWQQFCLAEPTPLEQLDNHFLSKLRFEFRRLPKLEQCANVWRSIHEKVYDVEVKNEDQDQDEGNSVGIYWRVDTALLAQVSSMIKQRTPTKHTSLSEFLDDCAQRMYQYQRGVPVADSSPATVTPSIVAPIVAEIEQRTSSSSSLSSLPAEDDKVARRRRLESLSSSGAANDEAQARPEEEPAKVLESIVLAETKATQSEQQLKQLASQVSQLEAEKRALQAKLETLEMGRHQLEDTLRRERAEHRQRELELASKCAAGANELARAEQKVAEAAGAATVAVHESIGLRRQAEEEELNRDNQLAECKSRVANLEKESQEFRFDALFAQDLQRKAEKELKECQAATFQPQQHQQSSSASTGSAAAEARDSSSSSSSSSEIQVEHVKSSLPRRQGAPFGYSNDPRRHQWPVVPVVDDGGHASWMRTFTDEPAAPFQVFYSIA